MAALVLLAGCNTPKTVSAPPSDAPTTETEPETEERNLDTLTISASPLAPQEAPMEATEDIPDTLPRYNASHTRVNDLLHTKLDLRFDWENEQVLGKATLKLKPYFYPTDSVTLDAKNFEFHQVAFAGKDAPLQYEYDGQQIVIDLGREYTRDEEYEIFIDYTASPNETGGSAAITSDKGLYFIDPRDEDPQKPTQIWTQGETEHNSKWFPTIDKPNERTTQEIYVTVPDEFETLSNGLLLSSEENADGTRTDYWKMDQPHAPYLFMLAIGDFAIVKETWENIPVEYYVEPEYEEHARAIFPYTPEMLTFFSEILGLKYPWQKYSQVVVRDFVSGAMENTTAVIFGEFVQQTERELIDVLDNEKIVAHEMIHHWFGDYVTTESWANLTMNEGFANYSEYLWLEHKYGADEADYHLLNEWSGYFNSAQGNMHPLIHFGYDDKEDMFDAHSYNKGGAVLHMLRNYVGDDAFYTALNKYLKENAYSAVEAHDLRLAFEEVTGEDMNWFWNQWFFSQGHPELEVYYDYNDTLQQASVTVVQTQSPEGGTPPIFQIPTAIDIYTANGKERHDVRVTKREQTFTFDEVAQAPKLMTFDADRTLLGKIQEDKDEDAYAYQFRNAPKFLDRYEAMQNLAYSDQAEAIFKEALEDEFWVIRAIAIDFVEDNTDAEVMRELRDLAKSDPHSTVRATAIGKLATLQDEQVADIAEHIIENDRSYTTISVALESLIEMDSAAALQYAEELENVESDEIKAAVSTIYANSGDPKYLSYFEQNFSSVDGFSVVSLMESYQMLAAKADAETAMSAMTKLKDIATDMSQSLWRRFGATRAINTMASYYEEQAAAAEDEAKTQYAELVDQLDAMLDEIQEKETDSQLQSLYNQMIVKP
jgi:aminopeptidase N